MAAEISYPRALEVWHSEVTVVVKFPKSLRTRCGEFWTLCGQLLLGAWGAFLTGIIGLMKGCKPFCFVLAVVILVLALIAFFTMSYWIIIIMDRCHQEPGRDFSIRDLAALQSVASTPESSPWQVNSAFGATFSTWNRNAVTKCFTTYRRMDVRVKYKGHTILQQQFPLGFSLKPHARRPFSIEMKSGHGQLPKDLGAYMQAELRSANISLTFFFDTRYLIADRRSKWESNVCVVVASSRLGTMLNKDC